MNFNDLSQKQIKAVTTKSQYVRIIACAGSGKTHVLTHRVAYLIDNLNVEPVKILCLTFTNKAANEMKERIINLLSNKNINNNLHISTFHTFCARFLRQEIYNLNIQANFNIIDSEDIKKIIIQICNNHKKEKNKENFINEIIDDIEKRNYNENYTDEKKREIFIKYEKEKEKINSLDFNDLILKTIKILKTFPQVKKKWNNIIKYILVDEFQDTNNIQFELIKLLSDQNTSIYVVGDPDQTIYSWRGADQNIILNFENEFNHIEDIVLEENYRSTKTILSLANKLIKNNKNRIPKDMFTSNINGEKPEAINFDDEEIESMAIVSKIIKLKNEGVPYNEIAILYRSNFLNKPIENILIEKKIPYRIFGNINFYQKQEIKDILSFFKLIINSNDDLSFERAINVLKNISKKNMFFLKTESEKKKLSFFEYIKNINNAQTKITKKIIIYLKKIVHEINEMKLKMEFEEIIINDILNTFLNEIGYFQFLKKKDEKNGTNRFENVNILLNETKKIKNKNDFIDWLQKCSLMIDFVNEKTNHDYVSLMTIHAAKGLEFNYVFIIGLSEKIFPSEKSNNIEEERRLCYVAFTRAKKKLFISTSTFLKKIKKIPYWKLKKIKPFFTKKIASRFIQESGLELQVNSPYYNNNQNYYFINHKLEPIEEKETNNIHDWNINDIVKHDKFGNGIVKKIIDDELIEIKFDDFGTKTMIANHKMLRRIKKNDK